MNSAMSSMNPPRLLGASAHIEGAQIDVLPACGVGIDAKADIEKAGDAAIEVTVPLLGG